MIRINKTQYNVKHFPDGTQMLMDVPQFNHTLPIEFDWKYHSDEELMTLWYLVSHYRQNGYTGAMTLKMSYCPNARMDRVYKANEVFTLKYFCNMINMMAFDKVIICDPHSNVCAALLDRVEVRDNIPYIIDTIARVAYENKVNEMIIYFPDYGAYNKYHERFKEKLSHMKSVKLGYVYGKKTRDWDTGKITGLEVVNERGVDLSDKVVLMVDDIVSYGGTMYYGALELKKLGCGEVYAFATHVEYSVLDAEKGTLLKALNDGTVKRLYCSRSLFMGEHNAIVHAHKSVIV